VLSHRTPYNQVTLQPQTRLILLHTQLLRVL